MELAVQRKANRAATVRERKSPASGWVAHGFSRGEHECCADDSSPPPLKGRATHPETRPCDVLLVRSTIPVRSPPDRDAGVRDWIALVEVSSPSPTRRLKERRRLTPPRGFNVLFSLCMSRRRRNMVHAGSIVKSGARIRSIGHGARLYPKVTRSDRLIVKAELIVKATHDTKEPPRLTHRPERTRTVESS